jgi:hypothetical protein
MCAVFLALIALFCLSAAAANKPPIVIPLQQNGAPPVGTEEPCIVNTCVFYAGDFDPNGPNPNGLWNQVASFFGLDIDGTVWVPFTVPKKFKGAKGKTDWSVTGLFVNNQNFPSPSATSATFSIVQGVTAGGSPTGGQVKVFCSGTAGVSATPTGRLAFNFYVEETYLATGISGCPILERGTYWMTLVAQVPNPPNGFEYNYLSDVEDNTPPNAEGPGVPVIDNSMFTSSFFGFSNFTLANSANVCGTIGCDNFSVGVIGTAVH